MGEKNVNEALGIDHAQNNMPSANRFRYPALRTISAIYMVTAWIFGIGGIITAIALFNERNMEIPAVISLFSGIIIGMGFAAFSEFLKVIIDIEYNTRRTSMNSQSYLPDMPNPASSFCPNCRKIIDNKASLFCGECGTKLK